MNLIAILFMKHTRNYDTKEMAQLIDGVVQECKQVGIETMTPYEIRKDAGQVEIEQCFICGSGQSLERHHIFTGSRRKKSEKYGLVVYLCDTCHPERQARRTQRRFGNETAAGIRATQVYGRARQKRRRFYKRHSVKIIYRRDIMKNGFEKEVLEDRLSDLINDSKESQNTIAKRIGVASATLTSLHIRRKNVRVLQFYVK